MLQGGGGKKAQAYCPTVKGGRQGGSRLAKLGHVCSWEGVAKAYASELLLCHFYCAVVVEGQCTLVRLKKKNLRRYSALNLKPVGALQLAFIQSYHLHLQLKLFNQKMKILIKHI